MWNGYRQNYDVGILKCLLCNTVREPEFGQVQCLFEEAIYLNLRAYIGGCPAYMKMMVVLFLTTSGREPSLFHVYRSN